MKPSPNKYLPNIDLTSGRRREPKYGFGTSTRSAMSTLDNNPSPNKYVIPSLAVAGPKMTIGNRNYKVMNKNPTIQYPGPNAYDL